MNRHAQFRLQPFAKRRFLAAGIGILLILVSVSYSQFVPGPNPINGPVVSAQTLSSGTGEVTSTGSVTVAGGANSITLGTATGQTYSLFNSGILDQTGTGRALRNNVNNSTITIINFATGLIRSNNSDTFQIAQPRTSITLENSGQIISLNSDNTGGDQAIDWNAIVTGANSLTNHATGVIRANAADAVRPGRNGAITNFGLIEAIPVLEGGSVGSNDGIDAQNLAGIVVDNSGTIRGRNGVTGGDNVFAITVTNRSGGVITGINGSGVNIDGLATTSTASVTNLAGGVITGMTDAISANGDGDGVDVDGVLTLINAGTVQGLGAKGVDSSGLDNNSEAVAAGGGTIINLAGGVILGQALTGNLGREARGILIDDGLGGPGVATTTVINAGTIRGFSGYAVKFVGNFADLINNQAGGLIRGAGTGAAIQMGDGDDQLINSGLIQGDNGLAIDLQGGNDTLVVTGGAANILGKIDGGIGTNTAIFSPGAGQSFSYAGEIANFASVVVESGTVTFSGNSTYLGTTTIRPSALFALFGTINGGVANAGFFKGTGLVNGNVFNSGIVSPGASIGTLKINGNYTQSAGGTLRIEVAGASPGQYDVLAVNGRATLAGTLQLIRVGGARLQVGDRLAFLTGGVSGTFSNVENDFLATDSIVVFDVVYLPNTVVLEGVQGSFAEFASIFCGAPNAVAVGKALDSAVGDPRASELIGFLNNESLADLCDDIFLISPEQLTSIFVIGVSLANVQTANLERRMDDIRAGSSGFSSARFAINGSGPSFWEGFSGVSGPEGKSGPAVFTPIPENRWGVFATGLGEFTNVDSTFNARGYDLATGGFTMGIDYRIGSHFAVGLTGGYAYTHADLFNGSRIKVNGGKLGLYGTAFASGFYLDTAVVGGLSGYDTRRTALQGTARGDTLGGDLNVLVAAGYDWKKGGLTIGPTASFQYTLVGFGDFTESGSLAPLAYPTQEANSFRTAFGMRASYDWKIGPVRLIPELRLAWQHEFGDTDYALVSSFASGAGNSFTVHGPAIGRDSMLLGAGFAIHWNDRFSAYAYYDGELFRTNYLSNNVSAGFRVTF